MTAIKSYLMRLIFCGFFVGLCTAILKGKRASKALTLCGGCLLILCALRPLLRVDLSRLPDLVTGLTRSEREAVAWEKNNLILRNLVEEQTASWIEKKGKELGMEIIAEVSTREAESGTFVPDRVTLRGTWTAENKESFTEILALELDIPPERQRWVGG